MTLRVRRCFAMDSDVATEPSPPGTAGGLATEERLRLDSAGKEAALPAGADAALPHLVEVQRTPVASPA